VISIPVGNKQEVFDSATGEIGEQKLENGNGEAERFYRSLPSSARVGFEACGNPQWFEDLLDGLRHEVWIGLSCSRSSGAIGPEFESLRAPVTVTPSLSVKPLF